MQTNIPATHSHTGSGRYASVVAQFLADALASPLNQEKQHDHKTNPSRDSN
jgi:hypothetical protein